METLDVVDAHCHLQAPDSDIDPVEDLITQMDIASVDLAVVFAVPIHKGDPAVASRYNDYIADAVKEFPDRLVGFGSIHPADGKKAVEEMERFLDLGLKGIKVHPMMQNFTCDIPEMASVASKAQDIDIPLLIHSYFPYNVKESERLYQLVHHHCETNFILAHMGGHQFLDFYYYTERREQGKDNVYFEVSSLPIMFRESPYTENIKWLIEKMGADRVIFGSNYPRYQLLEALSAFDELGLSFADSQQILAGTISELLKL